MGGVHRVHGVHGEAAMGDGGGDGRRRRRGLEDKREGVEWRRDAHGVGGLAHSQQVHKYHWRIGISIRQWQHLSLADVM